MSIGVWASIRSSRPAAIIIPLFKHAASCGDGPAPELAGLAAGLALGGLAGMSLRMFGIELDGPLLTQAGVAYAAIWLAVTVSRI